MLLGGWAWYRRWRGGHWEAWLYEQGGGPFWYRLARCSQLPGGSRPDGWCRGTPRCEGDAEGAE